LRFIFDTSYGRRWSADLSSDSYNSPVDVKRWSEEPVEQLSATIGRQLIHTETMTLARVLLARGAVVPLHEHENEQIATVLEGRLRFVVDADERIVAAGESVALAANVPHEVEALEDSVVLDVFSPVREDWRRGEDAYLRR
jgi:quercetin dioxygenase-like cupin family protein